ESDTCGGLDGRFVGGAMINGDGTVVGEEQASFDVCGGCVKTGEARAPGYVRAEPHRRLSGGHVVNEIIRGQNVVVVKSVQMEANLQLSEIVQTGDSVCLLLGLAQGGQQQRGEQSDDANDHQQFNQGER